MKIKILIALIGITALASSCRKQQKCPAYGNITPSADKVEVKG